MNREEFIDVYEELQYLVMTRLIPTIQEHKAKQICEFFNKIFKQEIILVDRKKIEENFIDHNLQSETITRFSKSILITTERFIPNEALKKLSDEEKKHLDAIFTNTCINDFEKTFGYLEK